jgi:hypothetical protein
MIEGGGELLGTAFDARLVDRVHFYVAPLLCGGPTVIGGRGAGSTAESITLDNVAYNRIGPDLRITGDVVYPCDHPNRRTSRSPCFRLQDARGCHRFHVRIVECPGALHGATEAHA